jgi:hypothetical protein
MTKILEKWKYLNTKHRLIVNEEGELRMEFYSGPLDKWQPCAVMSRPLYYDSHIPNFNEIKDD